VRMAVLYELLAGARAPEPPGRRAHLRQDGEQRSGGAREPVAQDALTASSSRPGR
jgi:hypothetical protein